MKMRAKVDAYEDVGFICDVCALSVFYEDNDVRASLSAIFGYGSEEDGNEYRLDLCLSCFRSALAEIKNMRRSRLMFDENVSIDELYPSNLGLVRKNREYISSDKKGLESLNFRSDQDGGA